MGAVLGIEIRTTNSRGSGLSPQVIDRNRAWLPIARKEPYPGRWALPTYRCSDEFPQSPRRGEDTHE